MLLMRKGWTYCKKLQRKRKSPIDHDKGGFRENDRGRKRRTENRFGFSNKSVKDSPALLIPGAGIDNLYNTILPTEYISLESITYELKKKEGRIRNINLRDKQEKLKPYSSTWMV